MIKLGTVIHNTLRPEHMIPAFAQELKRLDTDERKVTLVANAAALTDFQSEEAHEVLFDLFDALNEFAPPLCYFGGHPGNNSDFGYWPCEHCIEQFEGFRTDDLGKIPADYSGSVLFCNDIVLTYYNRKDNTLTEVWSM